MYESILENTDPNFTSRDSRTITYKGVTLTAVKDHYIYEVFSKVHNLGYFHYTRIDDAIQSIENTGYYDGFNYDYRLKQLEIID